MASKGKMGAVAAAHLNVKSVTALLPQKPRPRKKPPGAPLLLRMLLSPRFRRSLAKAIDGIDPDLRKLNLDTPAKMRQALIDAYVLLDKKKVTADDWLGRFFEEAGADLPDVRHVANEAIGIFIGLVNTYLKQQGKRSYFIDGYGNKVVVTQKFKPGVSIRDLRIQRPGQKPVDYSDRGHLAVGGSNQHLVSTREFKTRGASGELRPQTTSRTPRLVDEGHPQGTKLIYQVEGSTVDLSVDLADLVLINGPDAPALLREAEKYSRAGIRAGSVSKVYFATDDVGDAYIRVVTPYATDTVRRLIEKLLRDKSWQR